MDLLFPPTPGPVSDFVYQMLVFLGKPWCHLNTVGESLVMLGVTRAWSQCHFSASSLKPARGSSPGALLQFSPWLAMLDSLLQRQHVSLTAFSLESPVKGFNRVQGSLSVSWFMTLAFPKLISNLSSCRLPRVMGYLLLRVWASGFGAQPVARGYICLRAEVRC